MEFGLSSTVCSTIRVKAFGRSKILKSIKKKSKYLDWYFIKKFPLIEGRKRLITNAGGIFTACPNWMWKNPEVKEHLMQAASHWLERGASGWRLDVPNEIEHWFLERVPAGREEDEKRRVYRRRKYGRTVRNGCRATSSMRWWTIGFATDALSFFAKQKISSEEFVKIVGSQLFDYKMQSNFAALNLLSSHDTARFLTVAKKRCQASENGYCVSVLLYRRALGILRRRDRDGGRKKTPTTAALWSGMKPKWNKSLLETYKRLIRIRNANEVLRAGDLKFILAKGMVIGFRAFHRR